MANKWIIINGKFRMGVVEFHRDLIKDEKDPVVAGGGYWHIDPHSKSVWLYSTSEQYKSAPKDVIVKALGESWISSRLNGFKFWISTSESLSSAIMQSESRQPDWIYEKK